MRPIAAHAQKSTVATGRSEPYHQGGIYTGMIRNGAKPADPPAEQPTNFERLITQTTAKPLGLTIPQSLLLRADKLSS